eukprot:7797712-Alexandrium_andersonii.AAC.1
MCIRDSRLSAPSALCWQSTRGRRLIRVTPRARLAIWARGKGSACAAWGPADARRMSHPQLGAL